LHGDPPIGGSQPSLSPSRRLGLVNARSARDEASLDVSQLPAHLGKARGFGAVNAVTEPSWAADALTGSTWEQGPEELDQLIRQIDATIPSRVEGEPNCSAGSGGSAGTAHIAVLLDGSPVATVVAHKVEPSKGSRVVYPIEWSTPAGGAWLYEPGEAAWHTLSVEAQDNCGPGEGFATARFTINSVSIDVIGIK